MRTQNGEGAPNDTGAQQEVREWLESSDHDIAGVLWIGTGEDRDDVEYRFISCPSADSEPLRRVIQGSDR